MKCEHARELIEGEHDDALATADRESLEVHVNGCGECREFRAQVDAVVAGLDDLRSLTDIAIDRNAEPASVPWTRHLSGMLRIAAVLALFVTGGLVAMSLVMKERDRPGDNSVDSAVALVAHEFEVRLTAGSRERLIPVVKPTDHPRVHLVWLYTAQSARSEGKPQSSNQEQSANETGQLAHRNSEVGLGRDGDPHAI